LAVFERNPKDNMIIERQIGEKEKAKDQPKDAITPERL
jgi:hypothetical protein